RSLDRRALAGAVRAEQPEHFARAYGKRHVVDPDDRPVALREPINLQHGSSPSPPARRVGGYLDTEVPHRFPIAARDESLAEAAAPDEIPATEPYWLDLVVRLS